MRRFSFESSLLILFFVVLTYLGLEPLKTYHENLPTVLFSIEGVALVVTLSSFLSRLRVKTEKYIYFQYMTSILSSLFFLASVVVVLFTFTSPLLNKSFDFSPGGIYSLSAESLSILQRLNTSDKKIDIYCINGSDNASSDYCAENQHLLNLVQEKSPEKVSLLTLDFRKQEHQDLFRKLSPQGVERVVVSSGEARNTELTGLITEQALINSIFNFLEKKQKWVYFLQGKGEPGISAGEQRTYYSLVNELKRLGYSTAVIFPEEVKKIHPNSLLFIGANTRPYTASDTVIFKEFMEKGGKPVIFINPLKENGLDNFVKDLGLKIDSKTLLAHPARTDSQDFIRKPLIIGGFSSASPMTALFAKQNINLQVNDAAVAIEPMKPAKPGYTYVPLFGLFGAAPAIISNEEKNNIQSEGPLPVEGDSTSDVNHIWRAGWFMGVAPKSDLFNVKAPIEKEAEAVIFGFDSSTGAGSDKKRRVSQILQMNVLRNTVNYLHRDEELISIPEKNFSPKALTEVERAKQILPFFIWALPILTAFAGIVIWYRRQREEEC